MSKSLLLLALGLLPCVPAAAQESNELIHLPSARITEAVRTAAAAAPAPVLATTLEQRDDHAYIMVRRTESSAPELHEGFDDVSIVYEGGGVLVHGGTLEGAQPTTPGELRGGTIKGGTRLVLAPGDVVVIPAGVPHQVELESGKSIIYAAIKVRRAK